MSIGIEEDTAAVIERKVGLFADGGDHLIALQVPKHAADRHGCHRGRQRQKWADTPRARLHPSEYSLVRMTPHASSLLPDVTGPLKRRSVLRLRIEPESKSLFDIGIPLRPAQMREP